MLFEIYTNFVVVDVDQYAASALLIHVYQMALLKGFIQWVSCTLRDRQHLLQMDKSTTKSDFDNLKDNPYQQNVWYSLWQYVIMTT